jgi:hypothetical protein
MYKTIVLDAGNSLIKFKRNDGVEGEFPHALKAISETELGHIKTRAGGKLPLGYARVNGQPYAYGDQAERYGVVDRRVRAARYTADYYGVFAALATALSYQRGGDYALFGSHAPSDVDYRDDLMNAAAQQWEVEIDDRTTTYDVKYVNTFDEPQGGLMNVILTEDGTHYRNPSINGGNSLVIDIGGRTTDWLAVKAGGDVDYSLNVSTNRGIHDILEQFETELRGHYASEFKATPDLNAGRLRDALVSGVFKHKGRDLDCAAEVDSAVNVLLNAVANAYATRARGGADFDSIILTGGGAGLLHDKLLPILDHERVILADEMGSIHRANVRGGLKLWKLYDSQGALDE